MARKLSDRLGLWRAAAVSAAAATALAACTSGSPSASSSAKSFTFAVTAAPVSLDITKAYGGITNQIITPVTEKLEGVSSTDGKLSPILATKVSQPDATTLVYSLRSGVKFSDGSAFTATDVVWSLEHLTASGTQTAGSLASLGSVTATGPLEVTVKLKQPDPTARLMIAAVSTIQEAKFGKAHAQDLGTAAAPPVGTGPYEVSEYTTQGVTLARNPHYWGTKPLADTIHFAFITNDNAAQLAMRSGSIQGALIQDPKTASQWQSIKGATQHVLPSTLATFLSLDTSTAPLNDVHVRKAIAYSIDRQGVMTAGYGKYATLLRGLTPVNMLVPVAPSRQAAQQFLDGLPQYPFNLAKAKAELAQSAYPNGFSMTVPFISDQPYSQLTVLNLQQNMKSLGVTITPKPETLSQWSAQIVSHQDLGVQTVEFGSPPDPATLLGRVTGKANIEAPKFNLAQWSTPEVEQAQTTLTQSMDKATRWKATQTTLTAIANDVPYIPLYAPPSIAVLSSGFTFTKPVDLYDLQVNGTWVLDLDAR